MRSLFSTRLRRIGIILAVICGLILAGYGAYMLKRAHDLDVAVQDILLWIPTVTTYTQFVDTEMQFPDRLLQITGTYHIDSLQERYASHSTSTLTIPDGPDDNRKHSFTLENISIGNDVYTKIETDSPVLQTTIPHSPEWRHFTRTTIPENFQSISIPGPFLDNLRIFSESGTYIDPVAVGESEEHDGQTLTRYLFRISGTMPEESGPLMAILERIGPDGTIVAWVDDVFAIRQLVFENDTYRSTTTVADINSGSPIEAPKAQQ
jgi:hypothetical protein